MRVKLRGAEKDQIPRQGSRATAKSLMIRCRGQLDEDLGGSTMKLPLNSPFCSELENGNEGEVMTQYRLLR